MPLVLDTGKFLNVHPYTDALRSKSGSFVRTFPSSTPSEHLAWHKDKENRIVIPIKSYNWKLQFDNEIPVSLVEGNVYLIEKESYHRIIRGFARGFARGFNKGSEDNDLILFIKPISEARSSIIEFGNFY